MVKQLAGRAGRFGSINSMGIATTLFHGDLPRLGYAMKSIEKPLKSAGLVPTSEMIEEMALYGTDFPLQATLQLLAAVCRDFRGLYFLCNMTGPRNVARTIDTIDMPVAVKFKMLLAPVKCTALEVKLLKLIASYIRDKIPLSLPNAISQLEFRVTGTHKTKAALRKLDMIMLDDTINDFKTRYELLDKAFPTARNLRDVEEYEIICKLANIYAWLLLRLRGHEAFASTEEQIAAVLQICQMRINNFLVEVPHRQCIQKLPASTEISF